MEVIIWIFLMDDISKETLANQVTFIYSLTMIHAVLSKMHEL